MLGQLLTEQIGVAATLKSCIREVLGWNLNRVTFYHYFGFS